MSTSIIGKSFYVMDIMPRFLVNLHNLPFSLRQIFTSDDLEGSRN